MRYALILACVALSACSTVVRKEPVTVLTPVAQPCALPRPSEPIPIDTRALGWDGYTLRQKIAAYGQWALDWQDYGRRLNAATAACPEVEGN